MSEKIVLVKIGGSLLAWQNLPKRLRAYLDGLGKAAPVLVVGGGGAADFIRSLDSVHQIGENRSHDLALRALDLTAHVAASLLSGLVVVTTIEDIQDVRSRGLISVFAPRIFLDNVDSTSPRPLKKSWDVTTDSIAARLAEHLHAERLVLLKSVDFRGVANRVDAARAGLVDRAFPEASALIDRVEFVNLRADPPSVVRLSNGLILEPHYINLPEPFDGKDPRCTG